eukprot:TRINITY_DN525_c9_g1_i1.p1 TRINITY_DN525_c9_g1~~TRINITY_DN525_c9_g1_i1.p1  ORF type:complete len:553 (-),score=201.60 TRINITY_DN525_c9_g1_i1:29-1552(-)
MKKKDNKRNRKEAFERGEKINIKVIKDKKLRTDLKRVEKKFQNAMSHAIESEILLTEESGFLEPSNELEKTYKITQKELIPEFDIQTIRNVFDLKLDEFGPYTIDFSRNGKHVLLGGRRGHLAMFDYKSKKLLTELCLNETIRDVKILHNYNFFAVAQKKYVYMYDNHGTELHVMKKHRKPTAIEFLPYHFLLVSIGEGGWIRWQDTSTGKLVSEFGTKLGTGYCIKQNIKNGVISLGHQRGRVTMWSPNMSKPLVNMLCHRGPVNDVAIDNTGNYMITSGLDSKLKIWDIRTYKVVHEYYTPFPANSIDISQRNLLSVGCKGTVQIWKDAINVKQRSPYMQHVVKNQLITKVAFCPYEDILGIGHSEGFSSIVIPGAGEPNFDSFEATPYQTSKQRSEAQINALLDKIQPEMIALETDFVGTIDTEADAVEEAIETGLEPPKKKRKKNKQRGKNTSSKRVKKNQQFIYDEKREKIREEIEKQQRLKEKENLKKIGKQEGALERFFK